MRSTRRLTTEIFIERAKKLHGDFYDYSFVEYKNNKTKVKLICPKHGEFFIAPGEHVDKKANCAKCVRERQTREIKAKARSISDIERQAREIHKNKFNYDFSIYTGTIKSKFIVFCPLHGSFTQNISDHLRGDGCRQCSNEVLRHRYSYTTEKFIEVAKTVHSNEYDYSKVHYINTHQKVCILCKSHGVFWQSPENHIQGVGCPQCSHIVKKSQQEVLLYEFVKTLCPDAQESERTLLGNKQELDIYIPSKKVAIEYNGLYWHSDLSPNYKSPNRHLEKQLLAESKGIHLLQIWEDEWRYSPQVVKQLISAAVGKGDKYDARKCTIGKLDFESAKSFFTAYHIQGVATSASVIYGLWYRGTLVAAMSFGVATSIRGNKDTSLWELMRYASIGRVRGGGSKLLKAFEKDHPTCGRLISYCDTRLFTGNSYYLYGFKLDTTTKRHPDYMPVYNGKRWHKSWSSKQNLKRKFPSIDISKTEKELCTELNIAKVYDCGKLKFVKDYICQ